MKIVVVYGPPLAGKTTWIKSHIGKGDIVYDYDKIVDALSCMSGKQSTQKQASHEIAMKTRAAFVEYAKSSQEDAIAYICTTYPSDYLKSTLPDSKTEYVPIIPAQEECLNRLQSDEMRDDKESWAAVVATWYEEHGKEKRAMKIEIRADGAHISGYVNVTEKKSRPVMTPHGMALEEIEPRAFEMALGRAENVSLTVDHDPTQVYASTKAGTLKLCEDNIGLRADALVTDKGLIAQAREGEIKGWSFGMYNVSDEMEARADGLPIRHVKALDLDHVTLVRQKTPCYSATSVEVRADKEAVVETRAGLGDVHIEEDAPRYDNSAYRARVDAIRK